MFFFITEIYNVPLSMSFTVIYILRKFTIHVLKQWPFFKVLTSETTDKIERVIYTCLLIK